MVIPMRSNAYTFFSFQLWIPTTRVCFSVYLSVEHVLFVRTCYLSREVGKYFCTDDALYADLFLMT